MSVKLGSWTCDAGVAPRPRSARATRCRADAAGRGARSARARPLLPPVDEPLDEAALVRRVRRRVPHHEHERTRRVEPVAAQERLVLVARALPWKTSVCGQPGDDDPLRARCRGSARVVPHHVVLDDVAVECGEMHALADGVVPARDVRRRPAGRAAAPRRGTARTHCSCRLRGRAAEQSRSHRSSSATARGGARQKSQRCIARSTRGRARQRPDARRVEHPVRMPGLHPLGVEAVPLVEPDRERVVADLPVEPRVDARASPLADAARLRGRARRRAATRRPPRRAPAHARRLVAARRGRPRASRVAEPLAQPRRRSRCRRRPRIESRSGEDDPDRGRALTRADAPSRARDALGERRAVEPVEAQRLGRRAARRPALDAETSTSRLRRARRARAAARRRARRPARGPRRRRRARYAGDRLGEPVGVDAVEPRHRDDRERRRRARASSSDGDERLVEHHRPVRDEQRVVALAQRRAHARRRAVAGRQLDAPRRRADREPDRDAPSRLLDRPAHERARLRRRCTAARSSCPGARPSSETSRRLWCDLPGPGRDQPGVVERVDDLRPLARLVVDLLVRARGEEAGERVDDRQRGRAAPCPPPSRPCPARRCRTRRSGRGRRARTPRTRQSEARSASSTTSSGRVAAELDERLAVGRRRRTRRVTLRRRRGRRRRSPARPARPPPALLERRRRGSRRERRRGRARRAASSIRADELVAGARRTPRRPGAPACQRYVPPPSASATRVLHERDALPLDRVARRAPWAAVVARPKAREGVAQRGVVVAVAGHDVASRTRAASPRGRRARGSPPSACPTGARCGRRRPRARRRRSCAAAWSASQFWPSCSSPSPVITTTRPPRPSCRFAQAIPRPFEMPMPSEPEFASIPGTPTSGCPSSPPSRRSRSEPLGRDHAERVERRVEPRARRGPSRRRRRRGRGSSNPTLGDVQLLVEQVRRRCRAR